MEASNRSEGVICAFRCMCCIIQVRNDNPEFDFMAKRRSEMAAIPTHKTDTELEDIQTGLKPKEYSFALHLAVGGDPVKAYLDAGYSGKDFNDVRKLAAELSCNPLVRAAVAERVRINNNRYRNDASRVVEELKTLCFADITDYQVVDGDLTLAPGVPERAWKAIESVKKTTVTNHRTGDVETRVEFRMHPKSKALDLAMKHHGLTEANMPPMEIFLSRFPNEIAEELRKMLSNSEEDPLSLADNPMIDESLVTLPETNKKENSNVKSEDEESEDGD